MSPFYEPSQGPPQAQQIIRDVYTRSVSMANTVAEWIKANVGEIAEACESPESPSKLFFPVNMWGAGINPASAAMQLQLALQAPVFPVAMVTSTTNQRNDGAAFHHGVMVLVPRLDRLHEFMHQQGAICAGVGLHKLGGWSFFVDAMANFGAKTEADPVALLGATSKTANHLGVGASKPPGPGIYQRNDFPVPVLVQDPPPEDPGEWVVVGTDASLGIAGHSGRPQGKCPDYDKETFEWGLWQVKTEEWRAFCAAKTAERCAHGQSVGLRLFAEVTPGSWLGGQYRSAEKVLQEVVDKYPHYAAGLEAEAWAAWVHERKNETAWPTVYQALLRPPHTSDFDKAESYTFERWATLAERLKAFQIAVKVTGPHRDGNSPEGYLTIEFAPGKA